MKQSFRGWLLGDCIDRNGTFKGGTWGNDHVTDSWHSPWAVSYYQPQSYFWSNLIYTPVGWDAALWVKPKPTTVTMLSLCSLGSVCRPRESGRRRPSFGLAVGVRWWWCWWWWAEGVSGFHRGFAQQACAPSTLRLHYLTSSAPVCWLSP